MNGITNPFAVTTTVCEEHVGVVLIDGYVILDVSLNNGRTTITGTGLGEINAYALDMF
jgi:hypothetical protein